MDQITTPPEVHEAALSRASRSALGWSLIEASRRADVSIASVLAAEGKGVRPASSIAHDRLRRAYEEAGVRSFDDATGRGIRITSCWRSEPSG